MGFWSSLGSFAGSVISGAGSLISSIGSGVSAGLRLAGAAIRGIGSALGGVVKSLTAFAENALTAAGRMLGTQAAAFLGTVATILSGPLGPILGPMILNLVISAVIKVITAVAKMLKLVEDEEKVEDIGYRMEEADKHDDWKKPDDPEFHNSWKEYYEYLKQQIPEVDEEKIRANELHYQLLGMMAERQAIEQELGVLMPETFLEEVGRSKMTAEEVLAFSDAMKALKWEPVRDYLKDKLPPREIDRIESALLEALMNRCQGKTREELQIRLNAIRDASSDDRKLAEVYSQELHKTYGKELAEAGSASELPKFYQKEASA